MRVQWKRLQLIAVAVVAHLGIVIAQTSVCQAPPQIPDAARKLQPVLHHITHCLLQRRTCMLVLSSVRHTRERLQLTLHLCTHTTLSRTQIPSGKIENRSGNTAIQRCVPRGLYSARQSDCIVQYVTLIASWPIQCKSWCCVVWQSSDYVWCYWEKEWGL